MISSFAAEEHLIQMSEVRLQGREHGMVDYCLLLVSGKAVISLGCVLLPNQSWKVYFECAWLNRREVEIHKRLAEEGA